MAVLVSKETRVICQVHGNTGVLFTLSKLLLMALKYGRWSDAPGKVGQYIWTASRL